MKNYKVIVFRGEEVLHFYLAEGVPQKIAADAFRKYGNDISVRVDGDLYQSAEAVGIYDIRSIRQKIRTMVNHMSGKNTADMLFAQARKLTNMPREDLEEMIDAEIKLAIAEGKVDVIWETNQRGDYVPTYAPDQPDTQLNTLSPNLLTT